MGLQRLFLAVIQVAGLYGRTKTNPFQITKELWRRLSTQQPNIADRIWQIELRHDIILPWEPKLEVGEHAARQGRNPATGETVTIAAKKVPTFKAAKALKDAVE